jgi:hypothetical protein
MRIHSDSKLPIYAAAEAAGVTVVDLVVNDSRSRDYGYSVKLEGSSPSPGQRRSGRNLG